MFENKMVSLGKIMTITHRHENQGLVTRIFENRGMLPLGLWNGYLRNDVEKNHLLSVNRNDLSQLVLIPLRIFG